MIFFKFKTYSLLAALFALVLPAKNFAFSGLDGDPPGKISFSATNDKLTAEGTFDKWEITSFEMPDNNIQKIKLVIEVDLNSVNTGMEGLDEHLKADDFFDTANTPKAIITIKGANQTRNGYATHMTVNMKGKETKLISTFDVVSENPLKVKGRANFDRRKNGIGDTEEGAYGNLLNIVQISYEATMPQVKGAADMNTPPGIISYTSTNDKRTAKGVFEKWAFTSFEMPGGDIANVKATIEVDLGSVNSGLPKLDKHLRADDFFDVANFPTATITIDGAEKNRGGGYTTDMTVDMKGLQSKLKGAFEVISQSPLKIKGKANFQRKDNNIGTPGEGAYYNLEENVVIDFEATLPEKDNISFAATNEKLTANGVFENWEITAFNMQEGIENVQATIQVDLTSVKTGMDKLDDHLNADDFFDTKNHPTATITVKGAKPVKGGAYNTDLIVDMKGMQAKLPCKFQVIGENPLRVKGTAIYKRASHNIGETKEGAYYNLEPDVAINFIATMPETPPGKISFSATNDKMTANGHFAKWKFKNCEMTDGNLETIKANIEVDLKSVKTGIDGLDSHLNAADFFNTSTHPVANIAINGAQKNRGGGYTATMTVDMKGITSELPCTFEVINKKPLTVRGKASLQRNNNRIGDPRQGAYYNLEQNVDIEFEAIIPQQ